MNKRFINHLCENSLSLTHTKLSIRDISNMFESTINQDCVKSIFSYYLSSYCILTNILGKYNLSMFVFHNSMHIQYNNSSIEEVVFMLEG